jgi:hypothetical protein
MWYTFSDERTGLSFTVVDDPSQRSYSGNPSSTGLINIFYCLRFLEDQEFHIYVPLENGCPEALSSLFVSYCSQDYGGGI